LFGSHQTDGRKEHLFIVLTTPSKNAGKFAAFNLTKSNGGAMALTFKVGSHPFITRYPSDVNFGDAMIMDENAIAADISPHAPMDMGMVTEIAKKSINHPSIPEEVEEMVKIEWGL
jgi:hypothetical protein